MAMCFHKPYVHFETTSWCVVLNMWFPLSRNMSAKFVSQHLKSYNAHGTAMSCVVFEADLAHVLQYFQGPW